MEFRVSFSTRASRNRSDHREMTLKGGIKSRFTLEELDLMRKLAGMANNLNQVAKRVNRNEFLQVGLDLVILAGKIKELVDDR